MKKITIVGLALLAAGAVIFGVGYIGTGGNLSVANGNLGPLSIHLADGSGSARGIGGGRGKPMTTPPPMRDTTGAPASETAPSGADTDYQSFAPEGIKSIEIKEVYADVELLPSGDGQIHISSEKRSNFYCNISSSGGRLSIERVSGINIGLLSSGRSTLRVELPDEIYCELKIENSCGDVNVSGLTLGETDIEADMGNVSFENMRCTDAGLDTDCGSVYVSGVKCTGELSAQSDLGDVTVESAEVSRSLEAESSCGSVDISACSAARAEISSDMGDISAENLTVTGPLKLSCECGEIKFYGLSSGESIEIENDMGSVSGTLAGSFDDYSVESHASLGSNNLPEMLSRSGIQLKVFTDCGSIGISFEKD